MNQPTLGKLFKPGERPTKDAIHVAIAPVQAACDMNPGDRIGFANDQTTKLVCATDDPLGIIDPFLDSPVEKGDRFYMCLLPGTIESIRHYWSHPAFDRNSANIFRNITESTK